MIDPANNNKKSSTSYTSTSQLARFFLSGNVVLMDYEY